MFKAAIENLFEKLEDNSIPYLIERNYEMLPEKTENDLDLLVEYENIEFTKKLINEVLSKYNYYKALDGISLGTIKLIYVNKDLNQDIIRFDLNYMFHYMGIKYLDTELILKRRQKYKNFYIPLKKDELIMSLFTNYINNGQIKEKYRKSIKLNLNLINNYDALFIKEGYLNTLIKYITKGDWIGTNDFAKNIRRNIIKQNILIAQRNNLPKLIKITLERLSNGNNFLIHIPRNEYPSFRNKAKNKGMKCVDTESIRKIKLFIYKRFNGFLFIKLE